MVTKIINAKHRYLKTKGLNPILQGGAKYAPSCFPSTILKLLKLKLFDFKDTPLKHLLKVKPVRYILSCGHCNKITKCTSQNLAPKKSEKSVICIGIELNFGVEAKFGPLSSKTNINFRFYVIKTSLWHF